MSSKIEKLYTKFHAGSLQRLNLISLNGYDKIILSYFTIQSDLIEKKFIRFKSTGIIISGYRGYGTYRIILIRVITSINNTIVNDINK
jgi:hypothetical protein